MTKNEIIQRVVEGLMYQRKDLNYEVTQLNHNENSFIDRKTTLEFAISNIDMQIQNHMMTLELTPVK